MPTYRITDNKTGKVYNVTGPTQEGAQAALDAKLYPKQTVGVGEDMARSVPSGLKKGTESLIGSAEDTGSFGGGAMKKLATWLGFDQGAADTAGGVVSTAISDALNPIGGVSKILRDVGGPDLTHLYAPSSQTVKQDVETAVPAAASLNYTPQTRAGKFVHTGMEFVPGALAGPGGVRNLLTRGAEQFAIGEGSEAAGQLTEGSAYEPWARFGAGLLGAGFLGPFRQGPVTPQAEATLARDIPLTAGQATGSKGLKYLESELGGGRTQDVIANQRDALTARAMQEIGAPAGSLATPENMERELGRIGGRFNQVANAINEMPVDLPAQQAIMDAVDTYASRVGVNNQSPIVRQQLGNLRSLFNANGNRPVLTGVQYGALRSSLGEEIRNAADFHSADALRAIQDQLDNAAEARLGQINPNLQGQLADARRQYRLYLDLERAVANAPAHIAGEGQITPSSLRGGVKGTEGNRRLVTGQSEFTNLANDAAVAMSSVPESGTSARTAARVLPAVAAQGHPLAALGSLLAPIGMGRVLMSGPVQQMLMSAPQDARAALTALIAAGQARKQGQEGWR